MSAFFRVETVPLPAPTQINEASPRGAYAIAILSANGDRTMRAYVAVTGMALGLVGVWAALVSFVA
jgi:hypothetical protein